MRSSLAGAYGAGAPAERSRLAGALEHASSSLLELGPLSVTHDGPPTVAGDLTCLLTGQLDDAAALAALLDQRAGAPLEAVMAAGYRRWGARMLPRLRGDFVLLIWDRSSGEGLIARDQLGVRSLYLHDGGGVLRFATEVRELLAILPCRPAPDRAGVAHWLAASGRAGNGTLYEGVRRLAPGGVLVLGRDGIRERSYWSPRFSEPAQSTAPQLAASVREELARAVRRRLPTEGPDGSSRRVRTTGVLMSGGLDSATVAALAARERPGGVAALSGVFPEHPEVDESALIDLLRRELALGGVSAEVRSGGLLASALESQREWQLPLLSWGDFWTLPLLRAASAHGVRTVLGGDGGDELFATRAYLSADSILAARPREAWRLGRRLPGAGARPARRDLFRAFLALALLGAAPYRLHELARRPTAVRSLPPWLRRGSSRALRDCWDPLAWKRLDGPRWWAHAAHGLTAGIEQAGIFEMSRHRAALAGLQARHPMFDLDLLQLVLAQPPSSTFDCDRNRPALRAAGVGLLADSVRLRSRKALFDPLIVQTLGGADRAAVQRLLGDPRAELGAYVDLARVRRVLLDDRRVQSASPFQWMQQVWRLSTAESWLRAQGAPDDRPSRAQTKASPARVRLRKEPVRDASSSARGASAARAPVPTACSV